MKKFLLGLTVAALAFWSGVSMVGVVNLKSEAVSAIPALVENGIAELSQDKIEPLPAGAAKSEEDKIARPDETADDIVENDDSRDGISGWYSLENYPKMPEVSMIKLSGDYMDSDGNPTDKMILYSGIYTRLSEDIDEGFAESFRTEFKDNKVKFKTKKLKGITYQFEGVFFKNKTAGENGEELLRGTLRKFVKGKKVAEITADFAYYEPYCLH